MNKDYEFAGTFYPEEKDKLKELINSFKTNTPINYKSKLIIVPHAAYKFSGHAAMSAFQYLEENENIFIFAPSHHYHIKNFALPEYKSFSTPLGILQVNSDIIENIKNKYSAIVANEYFEKEHSIEVQLPFIQDLFINNKQKSTLAIIKKITSPIKNIKIIPILTGDCDYSTIADIISDNWENSSFIISSDLSHYLSQNECREIDTITANTIEYCDLDSLSPQQACGMTAIKGTVDFTKFNECSLIRTEMYNSGDINNEINQVVGYGAWFLYADTRNEFIKNFYSNYIINTVKETLSRAFNNEKYEPIKIPTVLTQIGATFVTLYLNNKLRGCIGSIYPTKPIILDLIDNTLSAAFQDARFSPLTIKELDSIKIHVSILSPLQRIFYKDEKDLLSKIYPYGIIIVDRDKRAVYLPEVWDQLPEREVFFDSLKEKAGLNANYFSRSIEVYKFTTTHIEE